MKYNDPTGSKATPGVYKVIHHNGKHWVLYAETNSHADAKRMHGNFLKDGHHPTRVKILDHNDNPINEAVIPNATNDGTETKTVKANVRKNKKHARPAIQEELIEQTQMIFEKVLGIKSSTSSARKGFSSGSSSKMDSLKQRQRQQTLNLKASQTRERLQAKAQVQQSKTKQTFSGNR